MRAEATGLLRDGDRVVGLTYRDERGEQHEVRAALTVAADGRGSTLRAASGLRARSFGAPMDALWFRLPPGGRLPRTRRPAGNPTATCRPGQECDNPSQPSAWRCR
jgi:2-polyprenyl-6-methoxyphenol hydroxylase-like FAD-dependent oxidoreductase